MPEVKSKKKVKPTLELIGKDGNVFNLLGLAQRVYFKNKECFDKPWKMIMEEAMKGDYNNVLRVLIKYFDVE